MWISKRKMRELELHIELIKDGLWKRIRELEARLAVLETKEHAEMLEKMVEIQRTLDEL